MNITFKSKTATTKTDKRWKHVSPSALHPVNSTAATAAAAAAADDDDDDAIAANSSATLSRYPAYWPSLVFHLSSAATRC